MFNIILSHQYCRIISSLLTKSEQVPSNVDHSVASEEYDPVEGQLQYKVEGWGVGGGGELFASAVTEHERGECTEPDEEDVDCALQDFVESSHF